MAYTIYDASIPVFTQMLNNLQQIIAKAVQHAAEHNISEDTLLQARLAPDMFAFIKQIQIATDHAKGAAARLSGTDIPKFEDTETTFAQLSARIANTLAFIQSIPVSKFDGAQDRDIELVLSFATFNFTGARYLSYWALPNFFFHSTTAYDILRQQGVALGKAYFLGK